MTAVCPGALYSNVNKRPSRLLSVESPDMLDLGSSAAFPHPIHSETGNGKRNLNVVIPNVGRGVRGYSLPLYL